MEFRAAAALQSLDVSKMCCCHLAVANLLGRPKQLATVIRTHYNAAGSIDVRTLWARFDLKEPREDLATHRE